ncbi:hypothetical protein M8C21_003129 [Ambrosia artemisiifolia]|uniref:Uncharacterized protein n=1 Tax=Ambrosia artemisiifolia TaxID=4212 RepID=A0AAD5CKD6_AMBAR|nr:hypothetical protein M8C21_003129 [Ambrosia artemisiifolia]
MMNLHFYMFSKKVRVFLIEVHFWGLLRAGHQEFFYHMLPCRLQAGLKFVIYGMDGAG